MNKKFDREFKLEAIRLATERDIHATEVERRLGIGKGMISRWKRQFRQEGESLPRPADRVPWAILLKPSPRTTSSQNKAA